MSKRQAVISIAEGQFCLITSAQLRSVGVSNRTAAHWAGAGDLVREAKGLYRVPGAPRTRESILLTAQMATGGVLSHRSAAYLWTINGIRPVRPELIVAQGTTTPRDDVIAYRRRLKKEDITTKGPFRLTTPSRTLRDLAAIIRPDALEVAVDDAVTRGITTLDLLLKRVSGSQRGTTGIDVLRSIVKDRIENGTPASWLETRALSALRAAGLPRPRSQWEIHTEDGAFVARPDLVYVERRLAIELDGDRYHAGKAQRRADLARQNRLVLAGWTFLRFGDDSVRNGEMCRSLFDFLRIS